MRRVVTFLAIITALLLVASPASAFAHNAVHNVYLHTMLDVLTLAVVAAPVVTVLLWGPRRRGLLLALVALVQLPVAVIAFVPIANPLLHAILLPTALALTAFSVWAVRRVGRQPAGSGSLRAARD
jgi:hypothetical protein